MSEEEKPSFFATQVNVEGQGTEHPEQEDSAGEAELLKEEADTSEELRMLLQEFNVYDKKQIGMVPAENVPAIFSALGYPAQDLQDIIKYAMMTKEGFVTFDELLSIVRQTEFNTQFVDEEKLFAKRQLKSDRRLLGFLKLLDEYRKKCEKEGNYKEAKKSKIKIDEIKEKEGIRKRNFLKVAHIQELNSVEQIQKKQFEEFSTNWDIYMSQYEEVALESLEKLKERHLKELQDITAKVRKQMQPKLHFSKHIIELRTKERNLVKVQQYEDAAKIRIKIEELENEERLKHQIEVVLFPIQINEVLELRIANLKKQQVSVLNALLKRIQRDRNQQLRQRQRDSQTLIIKNRNIRNDLTHKHQEEVKRAVESLREFMNLNFHDEKEERPDRRDNTTDRFDKTLKSERRPRLSSVRKDIKT